MKYLDCSIKSLLFIIIIIFIDQYFCQSTVEFVEK